MTCECVRCAQAEAMDHAVGEVIERFAECQVLVGGELTSALLPSPDGEWVRFSDLATERAAHEVTKAHLSGMLDTVDECARNLERAQAAEQRVAELELERAGMRDEHFDLVSARAALSSARELLEDCWLERHGLPTRLCDTLHAWLRVNAR